MGLSNAERQRRFIEKLQRAAKAGGDASHWQPEIATLRDALVGSQKELAQALTQLHQAKALIAELEAARPAIAAEAGVGQTMEHLPSVVETLTGVVGSLLGVPPEVLEDQDEDKAAKTAPPDQSRSRSDVPD